MHTTYGKSGRTIFIHDGDARGGPLIIRKLKESAVAAGRRWGGTTYDDSYVRDDDYEEVTIDYNDVVGLVADQVRSARISELESADDAGFLGYPSR